MPHKTPKEAVSTREKPAERCSRCIDFSAWLKENVGVQDEVVLKINTEGAEYGILQRMFHDGTISLIDRLYVWWHFIDYHFDVLDEEKRHVYDEVFRQTMELGIVATDGEFLVLGKPGEVL